MLVDESTVVQKKHAQRSNNIAARSAAEQYASQVNTYMASAMPIAALASQRRVESVREYAKMRRKAGCRHFNWSLRPLERLLPIVRRWQLPDEWGVAGRPGLGRIRVRPCD
jgi:hypothetical protein